MNRLLRFLLPSAVLCASLVMAGCGMQEQKKVLKLGHGLDQKHSLHLGLVYMAERLEEISGGKMGVDIYPGAILGNETQTVELLQIGSLAMTCRSSASLEGFIEEYKVFGIPYIIESKEHLFAVLDGEVGEEFKTITEKYLFRGLGFYDAGARSFYTVKKPIHTPEDLAGLKMRVMKSPLAVAMMQAFGGSATPISWPELYTALQSGVVDGAENNLPSFVTSHHHEVAKHFSFNEHTMLPEALIISTHVWNNLTEQEQKWLEQAVDESVAYQRELWVQQELDALEEAKAKGVTFYYPNKQLFMDKTAGMKETFRNNQRIWGMIEKIDAVAAEVKEREQAAAEEENNMNLENNSGDEENN